MCLQTRRGGRGRMKKRKQADHTARKIGREVVKALLNCDPNTLRGFFSSIDPLIRASEDVERAFAVRDSSKHRRSHFPRDIEGSNGRNLQLRFSTSTSLPKIMYTEQKIEGVIQIHLVDANTDSRVSSGPEASVRLNVLALDGDFNYEDTDDWPEDEFERHVVKERNGKQPLLVGDLQVSLNKGVGTLGELKFTDISSCTTRSGKFRLAVKVAVDHNDGTRIREAVTPGFMLKHRRSEASSKHHPPALDDEVWRLECIAKDGRFHQRLKENHINTVGDFVRYHSNDCEKLSKILEKMPTTKWKRLVDHAKTAPKKTYYICYLDETKNVCGVVGDQREFIALIEGDQFVSKGSLNEDHQMNLAKTLYDKASENWPGLTKYVGVDEVDLLDFVRRERAKIASSSSLFDLQNPPNSLTNRNSNYSRIGNAAGGSAFAGNEVNPAPMPSDSNPQQQQNDDLCLDALFATFGQNDGWWNEWLQSL